MTGALNAMVAAGQIETAYGVTIGNIGGLFGYNDGSGFGAISPATFRGISITSVVSDSGDWDLALQLNSNSVGQNYLKGVRVQTTSGTIRTYLASAASFSVVGSFSNWSWGAGGASMAWTSTSPSPRSLVIFY